MSGTSAAYFLHSTPAPALVPLCFLKIVSFFINIFKSLSPSWPSFQSPTPPIRGRSCRVTGGAFLTLILQHLGCFPLWHHFFPTIASFWLYYSALHIFYCSFILWPSLSPLSSPSSFLISHKSVLPGETGRTERWSCLVPSSHLFLSTGFACYCSLFLPLPSFLRFHPLSHLPLFMPSAPDSHHLDSVVAKGMGARLVTSWVQEHVAENPLWFLLSSMKSAAANSLKFSSYSLRFMLFYQETQ